MFGVCSILLKSSFNFFKSIITLQNEEFFESSGSLLASLWERTRTLEFILNNPEERIYKYINHSKLKKTPWNIKEIVFDIIKNESHPEITKNNQNDLLYIQYSFLSAIKHGNPYTLIALESIKNKNNLDTYISILTLNTVIEGFQKFSEYFCNEELIDKLLKLNENFTNFMLNLDLIVPQIITVEKNEFTEEFWDYLDEINEKLNSSR